MVKISNASYENEIHIVDCPFNKDSKNTFLPGRPYFGGGTAGKFRENGQKQGNLLRAWSNARM